jgi:hypothetical protein
MIERVRRALVAWRQREKLRRGRCSQCDVTLRDDDPLNGVCSDACAEARFFIQAW